jgi:hypothetical protein
LLAAASNAPNNSLVQEWVTWFRAGVSRLDWALSALCSHCLCVYLGSSACRCNQRTEAAGKQQCKRVDWCGKANQRGQVCQELRGVHGDVAVWQQANVPPNVAKGGSNACSRGAATDTLGQ